MLTPNPAQKEVIEHESGAMLALAGPGTGKTAVLVQRFVELARRGDDPAKIFCLTFTQSAAREMIYRISRQLNIDMESLADQVCTYHRLGRRILLKERPIKLRQEHFVVRKGRAKRLIEQSLQPGLDYKEVRSYIVLQKRSFVTPEQALADGKDYRDRILAEIYAQYQVALRNDEVIDFEDMIFETYRLFQDKPELAKRYASRISHLMIDEFQDTNKAQQALSMVLGQEAKSFLAVGDYYQSIYGFAGADCSVIQRFKEFFPVHETKFLAQNYRSTKRIVDCTREAAPHVEGAPADLLQKLHTQNQNGAPVEFAVLETPEKEADFVFEVLEDAVQRKRPLSNYALLFRTNRQMRIAEEQCVMRGWQYRSPGCGYWGRMEVRLVVAFLWMLENPNFHERVRCYCRRDAGECLECKGSGWREQWIGYRITRSGLDCVRYLTRDIVRDIIAKYKKEPWLGFKELADQSPDREDAARRSAKSFYLFIEHLRELCVGEPLSEQIRIALEQTRIVGWLNRNEELDEGDNERTSNVNELLVATGRFAGRDKFLGFVQSLETVPRRHQSNVRGNVLTLSTIHRAKGQEWPTVFVCGVTEGLLPHKDGEPEEEQRLLYVALSRAKSNLFVLSSGKPSDFLARKVAANGSLEPQK